MKWQRRDKKQRKKRYGMRIDSRSVFTIQKEKGKRGNKTRKR